MRKTLFSGIAACLLATAATAAEQSPSVIWTVGQADRSASEFALAPDRFRDFLANDFGYEDNHRAGLCIGSRAHGGLQRLARRHC